MASKRLPLSCENCRQRKIRCISSSYSAPCDTCARRGYASSCRFRRHDAIRPADNPGTSSLEDLLRQNIAVTTALLRQHNEPRLLSPDSSPDVPQPIEEPLPIQQAGRLIVSPTNHVRFVPSNDPSDSDLLDALYDSSPGFPTGFPFFEQPSGVPDELLDMLPPLPQLEQLKSAYFAVFSPLFHILHDPTFHHRYHEFTQNPKSSPLSFLSLLFVILSLSVTALSGTDPLLTHLGRDPSPGTNIRTLSAKYRAAAMRCLVADNFMFRHNLCTVQALVLLIYAINHAQGPAWSLLGTTLHIAVAIGCAVDPARLGVGLIEAEERRRCWAAVRMLYTIQNTCLGNLMPFRIEAQVDLPADVEDEDLPQSNSESSSEVGRPPTKMSYLLYKFRLYNLAFDICQLTSHDRARTDLLDSQIAHEQQYHLLRFSHNLDLEPYHQAHYYILSNYTNHLTLLLHRRWLPATGEHQSSTTRCEKAATTILANFVKLSETPVFRSYRWYVNGLGSFYAFFSITTLLILHGNGQLSPSKGLEALELILQCVDLLDANASWSPVAAKAADILRPVIPRLVPSVAEGEAGFAFDSFPELGSLFYDVPVEQWLTPNGFPWVVS
ncbi:fungal-specific transcription factor domain-containing protein [Aspergillus pseudoustus]|uniref:Fungal-specific transcription factor domain-containing protein n=1 Tax=Aspergillus pseudoustus TaxID=1810923 RepID=A0ABR4KNJ2_9EURO